MPKSIQRGPSTLEKMTLSLHCTTLAWDHSIWAHNILTTVSSLPPTEGMKKQFNSHLLLPLKVNLYIIFNPHGHLLR